MFRVVHLVDEVLHVIFAVDIASFAVFMSRLFDLVLYHKFLRLESPIAVFVAALDLACHLFPRVTLMRSDVILCVEKERSEEIEGKGRKQSAEDFYIGMLGCSETVV